MDGYAIDPLRRIELKETSLRRPTFHDTFMAEARLWSMRSTCPRAKVGCVLVSPDNYVLATGYNGAPSGAAHCLDIGCKEDSYGHCARSVHAELNAIAQAAKRGTALHWGIAYLTLKPCLTCVKALIQVGISKIIWETDYPTNSKDDETLLQLLDECRVTWVLYKG